MIQDRVLPGEPRAKAPVVNERRRHTRYALTSELRFTVQGASASSFSLSGDGIVVNISSSGMLFESDAELSPGDFISTAVDWPWTAQGGPLSLLVQGRVVWSNHPLAAISFHYHRFSSASSSGGLTPKLRSSAATDESLHAPTVLVVSSLETYLLAATTMPRNPVQRVSASEASALLKDGTESVGLLITDTLKEFAQLELSIPVIYLAHPDRVDVEQETVTPSMTVLRKPVAHAQFRAAVRQVLKRRKAV